MAKKKLTIKKIKAVKIPKAKVYKPKKITVKLKSPAPKAQKAYKVGQRTFKTSGSTTGLVTRSRLYRKAQSTGNKLPITPRSKKLSGY